MINIALATALILGQTRLKDVVVVDKSTTTVTLAVKQRLVVSVFENASTGASWSVKPGYSKILKLLGRADVNPPAKPSDKPKVGQGKLVSYTFEAIKKGKADLNLVYGSCLEMKSGKKPWDTRAL